MLLDNLVLYEKSLIHETNRPNSDLYYLFDFDDRSSDINMEFQHFHRFYEIHILYDREASHLIEGTLYQLKFFDITLLPPSKLHKSQYPDGPSVKRLIIDFHLPQEKNPQLQAELNRALSTFYSPIPIYRFERAIQEQLAFHLNNIFRLLHSDSETKLIMIHCEFIQFLSCLYNNQSQNIYNQVTEDSLTAKIYSITSYIHTHYHEDLSLESLAKKFYISAYYLSHQFKQITGFTITTYIQMTRIRNAQQMLINGDMKITEIATVCGFNSFSQFNRVFNKICGVSPSKMKNAVANHDFEEYHSIPIKYPS